MTERKTECASTLSGMHVFSEMHLSGKGKDGADLIVVECACGLKAPDQRAALAEMTRIHKEAYPAKLLSQSEAIARKKPIAKRAEKLG